MGPGTKNRQRQTAELCKAHLRGKYTAQKELVEEFIHEIEGSDIEPDITRWGQFTDPSRNTDQMIKRLDQHFDKWLNGDV